MAESREVDIWGKTSNYNYSFETSVENQYKSDITLFSINFLIPEISDTLKGSPTKNFGTVRQKISTENLDTPPFLSMNFFDTGNFVNQKQKGSPTKFLGFVRQQIFVENRDVPFVGIKLFDTRSFLKHRRVPLRNDSVLPDKTILTKIVIPAPSFIPIIFRYQKFSEKQKGSSTNFFGTLRQKIFNGKS